MQPDGHFEPGNGQYAKQKRLLLFSYLLLALPWFGMLPSIGAIILLYVMAPETQPFADLEKHRQWCIFSFWVFIAGAVASFVLFFIGIGFLAAAVVGVWFYYRLIKGAYFLYNDKPL